MFCGGCGARIPEGAAFCPACGLKVDESYGASRDEKGLGKRQAFGIAFLATFLGSVPGLPLGLLAAVASVLGIHLFGKNEDLVVSSVAGAALGLAAGTVLSVLLFMTLFGSFTGAFRRIRFRLCKRARPWNRKNGSPLPKEGKRFLRKVQRSSVCAAVSQKSNSSWG